MAVFSLGPLVVTNFIGYTTSRQSMKEASLQSIEHAGALLAVKTQVFTEEKIRLISSLTAGNTDLKHPVETLRKTPSDKRAKQSLEKHLTAKADEIDHALQIHVLSSSGTVLGSSQSGKVSFPESEERCSQLAKSQKQKRLVSTKDSPVLLVRHPFSRDELQLGHLCVVFEFSVPSEQIRASKKPKKRFSTLASRDNGIEAVWTNSSAVPSPIPKNILKQIHSRRRWAGRYRSARNRVRYGAVTPVQNTDWFVLSDVPADEALASLYALRDKVLFVGVIFVAVVIAGIGFTVRTFVGPISGLLDAIQKMEDGDLGQTVTPEGPKDLVVLTQHFNDMSQKVDQLQNTLENRVRERTKQLEKSQIFNESLIDSIDDNLLVVDPTGYITKANTPALKTYGRDIVGQYWQEVLSVPAQAKHSSAISRGLKNGEPAEGEQVHIIDDQAEIMSVQVIPLPASDTKRPLLIKTRPVSHKKSKQAQLIHSEKMAAYGLLAAGMAHEIGNPLSSIKSQLQRARMSDEDNVVNETLSVVENEVDRIAKLLQQFVGVTRQTETDRKRISVNPVVNDAVQLLRHNPDSRGVDIELDLDNEVSSIHADKDKILQVLLNLGINAIDAMNGTGTLYIETFNRDDNVIIRVGDTGPGVEPHLQQHIFEPHFTTKPADEGTGLGLFVSSRIVETLNGGIEYLSDNSQWSGATFEIKLPGV
jgi:signal transduction histidine kinase